MFANISTLCRWQPVGEEQHHESDKAGTAMKKTASGFPRRLLYPMEEPDIVICFFSSFLNIPSWGRPVNPYLMSHGGQSVD